MRAVEAVEKVSTPRHRHDDKKTDLSERAVFDDRAVRKGKRTPEFVTFFRIQTFSTASFGEGIADG